VIEGEGPAREVVVDQFRRPLSCPSHRRHERDRSARSRLKLRIRGPRRGPLPRCRRHR
jgi:hypothetical protein